ncbi:MAG: arsenate reductase [Rhodobacteraceae bacterium]|nr:arsenate reductase [Paracoccaceae bacterium]
MKLYGLKSCDTCRKARKALPAAEFVDVRADGVPTDVLGAALAEFGDALVNRKSTTWRGLDEDARARDPLELLKDEPTLMKRPLIVDSGRMTLEWSADVAAAWD